GLQYQPQQQAEQYHQTYHPQFQQQQQQQGSDVWSTEATGLRDVEDRFHQLNFDRARNVGRRSEDNVPDPTADMRAPQR
ncbi:unnamed protein product, partial [Pylaiella littoralis]